MSSTNRLQVALVRETTPGTTPGSPRMRKMRVTGEQLANTPQFVDSEEIRDDRMNVDPIMVMKEATGAIPFELSYPDDESPLSEVFRSAFFNPWSNTPQRFNDGVADSVITNVAATGGVITVTAGPAFVAGQLIRNTGFGVAGNNGVFKLTTGSATVPAVGNSLLTDEAAPPAAARTKVVGFQGASGDITATANGLGSTSLNFTTLGLAVGMWLKVGGTATADKFATAACNDWIRITAIAATAITADNLPSGWTTDAGTGKTIKVWFGDQIKNGVTQTAVTLEKAYLGQQTPVYIFGRGMTVNTLGLNITSRQKITGNMAWQGMSFGQDTTSLDASPDPATTGRVYAANANVGRVAEGGSLVSAGKNWAQAVEFSINNNLRTIDSVDADSPVEIREGECTITGRSNHYFGSNALLAKFYAGTPSSLNARTAKDSQAIIFQFPRITYRGDGNPSASGKNSDAMLPLSWQASIDTLTNAHVLCDRLEYYEA